MVQSMKIIVMDAFYNYFCSNTLRGGIYFRLYKFIDSYFRIIDPLCDKNACHANSPHQKTVKKHWVDKFNVL